jgi:capsular polysaccharide biosynthesis protein
MYVDLSCMELMKDFSNTLSKQQIEEMATVDEFEVVKEVQVSPMSGRALKVGILCGLPGSIFFTFHSHTSSFRRRRRRSTECKLYLTLPCLLS